MYYQTLRGRLSIGAAVLLLLVGLVGPARGDVAYYSAQMGHDVAFDDLCENSATDDTPLYGSPSISYNTLTFSPMSFQAVSQLAAPPADLTDGTLHMKISSLQNAAIKMVRIFEQGDYTLAGVGTEATQVWTAASFFVTISKVNGQAITPVVFHQSMTFTPNANGRYNLMDDEGLAVAWTGEVMLDIASRLTEMGVEGDATEVTISLDNTLFAMSETASVALVVKKLFGVEVGTDEDDDPVVPEPSSLWLLISGCCALLMRRRAS